MHDVERLSVVTGAVLSLAVAPIFVWRRQILCENRDFVSGFNSLFIAECALFFAVLRREVFFGTVVKSPRGSE